MYKSIYVPVDNSDHSNRAVACALGALGMGLAACLAYMFIDVERYEVVRGHKANLVMGGGKLLREPERREAAFFEHPRGILDCIARTVEERGYPPSVFAMLPRLVERAGRTMQGAIKH